VHRALQCTRRPISRDTNNSERADFRNSKRAKLLPYVYVVCTTLVLADAEDRRVIGGAAAGRSTSRTAAERSAAAAIDRTRRIGKEADRFSFELVGRREMSLDRSGVGETRALSTC
jgi:hypothetical protein